jgi:non-ribosomal peptide synthetase component E (peptide arylation enzyme)
MDFLTEVFPVFAALVGFPAILAAGINLLKVFGLPDGAALKVVTYANILAFVAVFVLLSMGKMPVLALVDEELGKLAVFVISFTAFATEIGLTKIFHEALKGIPLIGKSYSLEAKG